MMSLRSLVVLLFAGLVVPASAFAQEAIQFARTPDISPDGKLVAFSYLGDIWTVPATGGTARLITMHQAHEYRPVFSPDGKKIAFAAKRHGQYDVYVTSVMGGRPARLTYHSSNDFPCCWTDDGRHILFQSARGIDYPPRNELYQIPVSGGRVERITWQDGREGALSPDGKEIVYVRGSGTWYRKGYRGSANDDIWICDADGSNNRRVTDFDGNDGYPSWSPDRKFLYYVTETKEKIANIVREEIGSKPHERISLKNPRKQVTSHADDSVRRARLSRNGEMFVYECGTDLWVVSTKGGSPRKLQIQAFADDKTNPEREVNYSSAATEFAVSRDEKYIAFVVHGEIFLNLRGGGRARRITRNPANDHSISWAPDSKSIAFLSDRSGHEDAYLLTAADPPDARLAQARRFRLRRITNTPAAEVGLMFSPDGKRVGFLREGRLWSMKPDGSDLKCIVGDRQVVDYEWSPDSKWICYSRLDGSYASEMYIIPSTGATKTDPVRNITRYATSNAGITWSQKGNKIAFLSERGQGADRNVYVLYLQKLAALGTKPSDVIDWQDIHMRVRRISTHPATRAAINNNATMVAFRSTEGGDDLWVAKTDGTSVKRLTTENLKPTQIQWSRLLSSLIYFRDGNGNLRMLTIGSKSSTALKVPFIASMTIYRHDDYQQIFDQSWRIIDEGFYDPGHHGVDWKAVRQKYRPVVRHVVMEEDLHALIHLMLGELNASHLGIRASANKSANATADLGLLFDEKYSGPGLKVREIIRRGPADQRGIRMEPGDIITRISGVPLIRNINIAKLLNGKKGMALALEVTSNMADPKSRRIVAIKPTNRQTSVTLVYEGWIRNNAERIDKLSSGKLGYIHIPSMDKSGLDRFTRSLFSDNFGKKGVVLDVRYNGGGYTHDKVLNYLGGVQHTNFHQRHGNIGHVFRAGDRKFDKPVVLLINQRSFSDAEIFANGLRALKLGKLVGIPTGGRVIGTGSTKLIDGTTYRIPRTGVYTSSGANMEKKGVQPDTLVDNHPDQLASGKDAQLESAVRVLMDDLKRSNKGVASNRTPKKTPPAPNAGTPNRSAPGPGVAGKKN